MRLNGWIAATFSLALAGCATLNGVAQDAKDGVAAIRANLPFQHRAAAVAQGTCPPLPAYSAEALHAAAEELRAIPKGSPLAQMVVDYGKVRDVCRLLPKKD
jgi:predicted small secreted protein